MTTTYSLDPLRDPRWAEFVEKPPSCLSVPSAGLARGPAAHLRVPARCPCDVQTEPGTAQRHGILPCRQSSDRPPAGFGAVCGSLRAVGGRAERPRNDARLSAARVPERKYKYIEIRPRSLGWAPRTVFTACAPFWFHTLDLRPDAEQLLRSFGKSSVQRNIRRADREGLAYEEGTSEALLAKFYRLFLVTRRRHQLPPQPRDWFRNLMACLGESFKIRVASKNGQPIASIITSRYKHTLVYKYGCSDPRFQNKRVVPPRLWKAIQEAKQEGLQEFDLGRSDSDQPGLVAFKDHWGTTRSTLTYLRYPAAVPPTTFEK